MYTPPRIERFNNEVKLKYHTYSNLLQNLPFDQIDQTSVVLSLFSNYCKEEFAKGNNPKSITEGFFKKFYPEYTTEAQHDIMFRLIQFIERQVVIFDAIEDASFAIVNNMEGRGSIRNLKEKAEQKNIKTELINFLDSFKIRLVLTAHPTQFYPGAVLGIITDLTEAIKQNDVVSIKNLLAQLGKTPFIKKQKPTPLQEATSLIWYLENVFYETIGDLMQYIKSNINPDHILKNELVQIGFWPGGDRDGNPFVTHKTSLEVALRLRTSVLKCYYQDIRKLKRKITFKGVDSIITDLETKLYRSVFYTKGEIYITYDELFNQLLELRTLVEINHQGLYLNDIDNILLKLQIFKFHFATLDIRQNAKIQDLVFEEIQSKQLEAFPKGFDLLTEADKIVWLMQSNFKIKDNLYSDDAKELFESLRVIQKIQETNGLSSCHRYIISNNESALHVIKAFTLFRWCGVETKNIDIVPLFESISDLKQCHQVMNILYSNQIYKAHLAQRNFEQHIMLGFSDGTKDGGYLSANWGIYKAKTELTKISRAHQIQAIFFDGRGGPPARGGGKTHKFYASLGSEIESKQIQLTIQGQTISSNFGIHDSSRYNIENLLSAGATSQVFDANYHVLSLDQKNILDELSDISLQKYLDFKAHPQFLDYLEYMTPLNYYAKTNIGSRPAKRKTSNKLEFDQLRAIPFVGAWSMQKLNVPGFYGFGTALNAFEQQNKWELVSSLYKNSLFFRTLVDNAMMALAKSFVPLTQYMKHDAVYGSFWQMIYEEFKLTEKLLLKLSGFEVLMQNYPDGRASVEMRENIVLPLLTIQQYALIKLNEIKDVPNTDNLQAVYEKMIVRSLFGNINASRNSA